MVVTPRARGVRTAVGREGLGLRAVRFQPWSGRWPAVVPVGWGAHCKIGWNLVEILCQLY